ncbi:MFS transporter [Microbispora siamensis]|uniref:MFS transporter n=1 Tax=Microbispora siamensis TaxID=564413 RepID=A0ABQ4H171_9ACTN|nr:MFS transporter [Microbispora siamensis]GIH67425.1 MFS transporter [Microbispora siamensis]
MSQSVSATRAGLPQLIVLLVGSCMPVLGAVLLSPVLPRMSEHFAATPGAAVLVPVVLTVPALFVALGAPFAGAIADRFDRKRLLIVAMVAYSVFGTAPLYLDSLQAILVSRVLVGVCEAAIMTCCTTLIADYWSGPRRARYLGMQTLATTVAATVFFALGGLLGAGGWRTPFWMYAAAALTAIPMAFLLWQPAASRHEDRQPWPWRALALPSLVTVGGGVVFYTLIVQLSYVLDGAEVADTAAIGGVTALMSLATAVGAGLFAKAAGRGARALLVAEFALSGLGLLLIFATGSVPVIVAGAVLTGFATGLLLPTLLTWAVGGLPFARRGRGTGLWTAALFLGEFLSPLLVSALTALTGGLGASLAVIGVASLALAALVATVLTVPASPLDAAVTAD